MEENILSYDTLSYKKYTEIQNNILYYDNDTDRTTEIISIVYDLSFSDAENLTITEYSRLAKSCEFLKHEPDNTLRKIYNTIDINGITYELFTDIQNMKVCQYIDFNNYILNSQDNIPQILSCFLIPQGHSYNDGYDIKKTIEDISACLSVNCVMQLSAFFLNWSLSLIKGFTKTKIGKIKKMMKKEKNPTLKREMKRRIEETERELTRTLGMHS